MFVKWDTIHLFLLSKVRNVVKFELENPQCWGECTYIKCKDDCVYELLRDFPFIIVN